MSLILKNIHLKSDEVTLCMSESVSKVLGNDQVAW